MSHLNKNLSVGAVDLVTLGSTCEGDSGSGSHEYADGNKKTVGVVAATPALCSQVKQF